MMKWMMHKMEVFQYSKNGCKIKVSSEKWSFAFDADDTLKLSRMFCVN